LWAGDKAPYASTTAATRILVQLVGWLGIIWPLVDVDVQIPYIEMELAFRIRTDDARAVNFIDSRVPVHDRSVQSN